MKRFPVLSSSSSSFMSSRSQSEPSGRQTGSSPVFGSPQQDANSAHRGTEPLVVLLAGAAHPTERSGDWEETGTVPCLHSVRTR